MRYAGAENIAHDALADLHAALEASVVRARIARNRMSRISPTAALSR